MWQIEFRQGPVGFDRGRVDSIAALGAMPPNFKTEMRVRDSAPDGRGLVPALALRDSCTAHALSLGHTSLIATANLAAPKVWAQRGISWLHLDRDCQWLVFEQLCSVLTMAAAVALLMGFPQMLAIGTIGDFTERLSTIGRYYSTLLLALAKT